MGARWDGLQSFPVLGPPFVIQSVFDMGCCTKSIDRRIFCCPYRKKTQTEKNKQTQTKILSDFWGNSIAKQKNVFLIEK